MTSELPSTVDEIKVKSIVASASSSYRKPVNYSLRFRNITTLYYVTIGVVVASFCLLYAWGASATLGSAFFVLLLMFLMLAIGVSPIVIVTSFFVFIVCIRYLILDRLTGRQRTFAIVTSIISFAFLVASSLYFSDLMKNI